MKYFALVMAAGLLAGCQDELTTATDPTARQTTSAEPALRPEAAAHAQIAIDDALDRIIPTLGNAEGAGQIASALAGLRNSLAAGKADDRAARTNAARQQVERYAQASSAEAAELDAVRLAIGVAASQE